MGGIPTCHPGVLCATSLIALADGVGSRSMHPIHINSFLRPCFPTMSVDTNRHLRAKMVIPFLFGSNVPHQILINVLFLLRPRLEDCGCVATRHVDNSLALLHHLPLSYTPYHSPQNADSPRLIPTNGDPYAEHSYPTAITSSHAQRQPSASLKS